MVAVTVLVAVLITETLAVPLLATYTADPSGLIARPAGKVPVRPMTLVMVPVAVLIAYTTPWVWSATYRADPSGVTAESRGSPPTAMVAVTVSVAVSTTAMLPLPDRVPLPELET